MLINFLTCTPEYFSSILSSSILGRAREKQLVDYTILNLRDYADGNIKKIVDDKPYGGGAGQVLKIEPIVRALDDLQSRSQKGKVYLTSAGGRVFNQQLAQTWSQLSILTFICGHYEGVDERVKNYIDEEVSLGQFVLTGGEPAVAAMVDATVRLLPGVLGNPESLKEESFINGKIEYPQYTRPAEFRGLQVPEILLSGNHRQISAWRSRHQKLPVK